MRRTRIGGHLISGFPDHFQRAQQGQTQLSIGIEMGTLPAFDEGHGLPGGFEHVLYTVLVVVKQHTGPARYAQLRRGNSGSSHAGFAYRPSAQGSC